VDTHLEKNRKSASYTQGDKLDKKFEDMLMEIDLTKPRNAYSYFLAANSKPGDSAAVTSKKNAPKWKNLSASERKKYEDMQADDVERYREHLELVKKHLVHVPPKENATSYRVYLEDYLRGSDDPKKAQKEASHAWEKMSAEQKAKWHEKRRENKEFYENLKKKSRRTICFVCSRKNERLKRN